MSAQSTSAAAGAWWRTISYVSGHVCVCVCVCVQLLAAKRCVLLTCVQHARTFHKHTWAQSSIETLAEHVWNHRYVTHTHTYTHTPSAQLSTRASHLSHPHPRHAATLMHHSCRGQHDVCVCVCVDVCVCVCMQGSFQQRSARGDRRALALGASGACST